MNNPYQNFEQVDLDKILKEIISDLKENHDDSQMIIHSNRLPVVKAVGFQMKQLLNNLIGNALKYRDPGRTLEIRIVSEKINAKDLKANVDPSSDYYHKISVIDNGIGFDNIYAEKIFELFQRLNDESAFSGTGIGLSICRKIAENHNGLIMASGRPGEGATFDIYLPATPDVEHPDVNLQKPLSELLAPLVPKNYRVLQKKP